MAEPAQTTTPSTPTPARPPAAPPAPTRGDSTRSALRGHDFAAQEQMLAPEPESTRRAGLAVVEGSCAPGAGPAREVAPPISYSVPPVVAVARIANPVERNQAINQSYNAFDTAMTAYLGQPLVSNWCTYGQHASREAGAQIRNLKAAKSLIGDMGAHLADFQSINITATNPMSLVYAVETGWTAANRAWNDAKVILSLLREEGLAKQSVLLWLGRAGITEADLRRIESEFAAIANMSIRDVDTSTLRSFYDTFVGIVNMGIRLATAIPGLIGSLDHIYNNMVRGNREIYESIGPAYSGFLAAGLSSRDGVVRGMAFGGDQRGFLAAAFDLYGQVRERSNRLAVMAPDDPQRGPITNERQQLAHRANLLIGYQEQLVILQPIFDTMQTELSAMSGTMVLRDPNGTHQLAGNWGNFYTRMGLDPARTPPLDQINARNLGELLDSHDPARHGTISEYFQTGLTNRNIHRAPSAIRDHG